MGEPAILAACLLDAKFGWPDQLYRRVGHPVGLFARCIEWFERKYNRAPLGFARRRALGICAMLAMSVPLALLCGLIEQALAAAFGTWHWIGLSLLAWPALAQRSLFEHVEAVRRALANNDVSAAQIAVGRIVGRDTELLDTQGVVRAAIESLSESFCDAVVAPLFWFALAGLPGIWCYKLINTADSMIGHKEDRWRAFGWAAARTDDVANWLPARLSAVFICLAGGGGWSILRRDASKHASPNSGWPEAAMAGALRIRLAGPACYDGLSYVKPWIGEDSRELSSDDIASALVIYRRACVLAALIIGGTAWLL